MSVATDSLRIAIFSEVFLPKIDGIVSILQLMLQRMQEKGHHVILFGPAGGPQEFAGAEIVGVSGPKVFFYPDLRVCYPRPWIYQRVKRFRPDVIHAVNPFVLGAFGLYCAQRLQTPTLASYHTDMARYADHYGYGFTKPALWSYLRAMHNRADVNLCPSSTVRDELRTQGFQRVRWWKRGIDTDHFTPGSVDVGVRNLLTDGHPDDFLLINVGRQAPEKGLFAIRDAIFPQPGVRLALVGGGPAHEDLKDHFAGTPTVFPGYLRGQDLVDAYRAADAFLFPSTTETFGLVALEAMACRVPVLAARSGGILDIVRDGENGFYFDPNRPSQMGNLVRRLRENPALRDELGANALRHARSQSWRATMDQLIDYYRLAIRVNERSALAPQSAT